MDEPTDIASAVAAGDRRRILRASQAEIVRQLEDADPTQAKGLLTELRLVTAELDSLGTESQGDAIDELAQRRSGEAAVSQRPTRSRKRRTAGD